ncbi:pdz/dhr/glgf protein [Arcanobacterium haemolyticum]|nr:pdz/dhr/glgf protein [Arcanobacterium haemolyticum]
MEIVSNRTRVAGCSFGVLLAVGLLLPGAYMVEDAGPALEVSGAYEGTELLTISGAPTYASETDLYMTTVSAVGNADSGVTGAQALIALLSKEQQLIPVRAMYTKQETASQVDEQNAQAMASSQDSCTVAGLEAAGYAVPMKLTVSGVEDGTSAADVFQKGDVLSSITVNGTMTPVTSFSALSSVLAHVEGGAQVTVGVQREGVDVSFDVTTKSYEPDETGWVRPGSQLGIYLDVSDIQFPVDVTYGIKDVGGPSAGSMFALAIYDKLTDGSLGGANKIAGTGTMSYNGLIGPIGGITHKMAGAAAQGATYFLAPALNCAETIGYVPEGMDVFAVRTLQDSIDAAKAIAAGQTGDLLTCEQVARQGE